MSHRSLGSATDIAMLETLQAIAAIAAVVAPAVLWATPRIRERWGHISWAAVRRAVKDLHRHMYGAGYRPDYIVCLGRGGAIVGGMLSYLFGKPNIPIIVLTIDHRSSQLHEGHRDKGLVRSDTVLGCGQIEEGLSNVLVLGIDIVNGGAMKAALAALESRRIAHSAIACVYMHPDSYIKPEFYARRKGGRLQFPWMSEPFERTWGMPVHVRHDE